LLISLKQFRELIGIKAIIALMKRIVYDAEAFIAALTQHIPDRSFQMLRYYGFYSNKSRGLREKERKRMKKRKHLGRYRCD